MIFTDIEPIISYEVLGKKNYSCSFITAIQDLPTEYITIQTILQVQLVAIPFCSSWRLCNNNGISVIRDLKENTFHINVQKSLSNLGAL